MKLGSLALTCMVGSVAAVQQTSDIYYQNRVVVGEGIWSFGASGVNIYSSSGDVLKTLSAADDLPMCTSGDDKNECYYFDYATDGHKYVWAAAFSPNRVDVFDIETGDYVTYIPTCSTPLDLDYHPNSFEMWIHCAGTDEANGHDGHIDAFSVNSLSADFKQINLNVTGRAYGRAVVHSTLGNYGYATVYKQPYLYKMDLATKEIAEKIEMPLTWGAYDMTYSPVNGHLYLRTRVTCTCGGPDADKESCGRGGPSLVDVLTGPSAGSMQVNGTTSGACEGSKADTLGVYEYDTKTDELVASHNIKEGTGFGADPASSPDGKYILLMGNDGGQNLRVLQAGENGVASAILADIPVEFEGGAPGAITISDFAFVTNNGKTILVVAAASDNNIVLVDMDESPLKMRKLALTTASESTGGRSRAVEWAIGSEYVWVNGAETDEAYVVQIPGDDIDAAFVAKTIQSSGVGQMMFVKDWERHNQKILLTKFLDDYFDGDAPAEPPAGELPTFCFSGENTVEVQGKGMVTMDSLSIGDSVRVEGGEFAQVYSFGHRDKDVVSEYLQIRANGLNNPLEISKDHMLYIHSSNAMKSVPAESVKVGDMLVQADGNPIKIAAIKDVKRRGVYAPFTTSGNIAVSGIMASNYVSLMSEKETGLPVSMQWIAHTFNAPHRMICSSVSFAICENETYSNGVSNWVIGGLRAGQWLAQQSSVVKIVGSAFLFASLLVVAAIEFLTPFVAIVMALGGLVLIRNKKSQKSL